MCSMIPDIIDYILSLVTGYSRAQRVLLDRSVIDLVLSLWRSLGPVSYKIHDPRVITNFERLCLDKFDRETFANLQNDPQKLGNVTNTVIIRLRIDEKYRHLVEDAVIQISRHIYHLETFEKTTSVQVDGELHDHRKVRMMCPT